MGEVFVLYVLISYSRVHHGCAFLIMEAVLSFIFPLKKYGSGDKNFGQKMIAHCLYRERWMRLTGLMVGQLSFCATGSIFMLTVDVCWLGYIVSSWYHFCFQA